MPEQHAGVMLPRRLSMRSEKAYLLALAERWLRPADQLDDLIRRWVIRVPLGSAAPTPLLRRSNGPKFKQAIERHLRAGYVLELSISAAR